MKVWKIIAQNILSGCVGGLLVIGSAQGQKPITKVSPQFEVRTQRLVIVNEKNKECGRFDAYNDGAEIRLQAPKAFMQLRASDSVGSSVTMGLGERHSVLIDAAKHESRIHLLNETHSANLSAGSQDANMSLAEHPPGPSGDALFKMPLVGAKTSEKSHMIMATVNKDNSSLGAFGQQADLTVGNEKVNSLARMSYNIVKDSGSIDLRGPDRFHWSQPPMFGSNTQ